MAVPGHRITRRRSKFSIFGTRLLGVDLLSMRFRLTVTCTLSLLYYSIILLTAVRVQNGVAAGCHTLVNLPTLPA